MICAEVSVEYFCTFCTQLQKEKEILNLDESINIFLDLLNNEGIKYNEDIFILPSSQTSLYRDSLLIGNVLHSFNESKSIKRMKIEIYDILEWIDFIYDEDLEVIQLKTFIMKDEIDE